MTSRLVLGAMYLGTRQDDATSFAILDAFVAGGGRWIDTANIYAFWESVTGEGGPANPVMGLALIELAAEAGDQHAVRLKQALAGHVPSSERGRVDEAKRAWVAEFGPVR